jgi:hypothetical protein
MAALRNKIASLESEQKMHRMAQKMERTKTKIQAVLEKMKAEADRRELLMKMEADKKEMSAGLAFHSLRSEMKELVTKAKADKKELVMKADADKKEMSAQLALHALRSEMKQLVMKAEADKKEMSAELALLSREMERKEMRSQMRELELRVTVAEGQTAAQQQHHQQMEPLKWEARHGQMEQQLAMRPHDTQPSILGSPLQHMINPNLALQQGETEQRLHQQLQLLQLKQQHIESNQPHTSLQAPKNTMGTSTAQQLVAPQDIVVEVTSKYGIAASVLQSTQPCVTNNLVTLPSAPQRSVGSAAALPPAMRPLAPSNKAKREQTRAAPSASCPPSKTAQPQHQLTNGGPIANVGSVPLPSGARTHFFLSHCQATGGDQTNAIYLELRQMGFSCWYSRIHSLPSSVTHISYTVYIALP